MYLCDFPSVFHGGKLSYFPSECVESPLPDALDEVLPVAGPSVMPQRPLFEETPTPMELDINHLPVRGPVSSGESQGGMGST